MQLEKVTTHNSAVASAPTMVDVEVSVSGSVPMLTNEGMHLNTTEHVPLVDHEAMQRQVGTDVDEGGEEVPLEDPMSQRRLDSEMTRLRKKVINRAIIRKGKWTMEESQYAEQLIVFFKERLLQVPKGTMLRMYLAEKLHCEPMRITKKFSGKSSIGKQVYSGFQKGEDAMRLRQEAKKILKPLERRFLMVAAAVASSTTAVFKTPDSQALGRKKRAVRKPTALTGNYEITGKENVNAAKSKSAKTSKAVIAVANAAGMTAADRKRSNSIMDDERAGDLLMDFVSKVNPETSTTRPNSNPATTVSTISTVV